MAGNGIGGFQRSSEWGGLKQAAGMNGGGNGGGGQKKGLAEAGKQAVLSAAKIGAHSIDRKKKRDAAVAKVARKTLQDRASGADIKAPTGI